MDYISGWCKSKRRLEGTTAVVTGSNNGIGKETARDLYLRGARVIMACRDITKANNAKNDIEETCKNTNETGSLIVEKIDLSSLKSVREFAENILKQERDLSILINNAGVMMCPEGKTEDGFETHIGSNHFGHALLTLLLLPLLIKNSPSRIVFVSSYLHQSGDIDLEDLNFENSKYDPLKAYSRSKAANVVFAKSLALKLKEHGIDQVNTYSLHPGVINTGIGRHFSETAGYGTTWIFNNILSWFIKSPRCGAQTTVYCAVDEACASETGLYYSDCAACAPSKPCQDEDLARKFWDVTVSLLNMNNYDPFQPLK